MTRGMNGPGRLDWRGVIARALLLSASACFHSSKPALCEPPPENLEPPTVGASARGGPRPFVSASVAHQLLAIAPGERPYRVIIPSDCHIKKEDVATTLAICVTPEGNVSDVTLLKASTPIVDRQLPTVIGRWRYRPFLVEGQPSAFCYRMVYRIHRKDRTGWLF